jgi:hypothetical protein
VRCHDFKHRQATGRPDEIDVFIHWFPLSGRSHLLLAYWLNKLISLFTYWTRAPPC